MLSSYRFCISDSDQFILIFLTGTEEILDLMFRFLWKQKVGRSFEATGRCSVVDEYARLK